MQCLLNASYICAKEYNMYLVKLCMYIITNAVHVYININLEERLWIRPMSLEHLNH